MDGFSLYSLVKALVRSLVLPPGGPLLLVVLGLLVLKLRARLGRALIAAGAVSLWLLATPWVSNALLASLSPSQAAELDALRSAQALVVLGGGLRREAAEYGGDTLGRLTSERVRYGARLARATGLPVLVSGGPPEPDARSEAEVMREALEREYGVAVKWSEDRSRNTRENARFAAELLRPLGIDRVALVVHGFDVPRAREEFARAGFEVMVAPTVLPSMAPSGVSDWLPGVYPLTTSYWALYEWLGRAAALWQK